MALTVAHSTIVSVPDDGTSPVGSAEWNAAHIVTGSLGVTSNAQTGTSYTLQSSDDGTIVTLNNASAITLTCPTGLPANFSCLVVQLGAGQVSVVAGGGATLNSLLGLTHLSGQYAMGTIIAPTAGNFLLGGQIS